MKPNVSAVSLALLLSTGFAVAQSGVYVGGHFRRERPGTVTALKASGFNTVILFNIDVDGSGNLSMDGQALCSNGMYTFSSTNPNYVADVTSLKSGSTSVNRVECCVGGWGNQSYTNIRNFINANGTGSGTNLYRNFQALKNAIPAIDAINDDDEGCYDVNTATAFHVMLAGLGYKTTLAPYMNKPFWSSLATNVNNQRPGTVDRVYLQCYEGGAGNNPSDWHLNNIPLHVGLENFDSTATVNSKMNGWKSGSGALGGFLWVYNDNSWNLASYAGTINGIFKSTVAPPSGWTPYFMIVNKFSGKALDLIGGDTSNGARINQWSFDNNGPNQRWAILPTENNAHFRLVSFVSGKCACIDGDSMDNGAQLHSWDYVGNNPGQQFDLVDVGSGWFKIRNVKSGKILDDNAFGTGNDNKVQQWDDGNTDNQIWRLQPQGDYFIKAASGRYICVQGKGNTDGSRIIQYDKENNPWFKWRFLGEGNGWYGCFSLNALSKVLCVGDASTQAGHFCHLWEYNVNNGGDQKVRVMPQHDGTFKFYFASDGQTWDIPGGQTGNNVELEQYPDNGNGWQKFSLERIP